MVEASVAPVFERMKLLEERVNRDGAAATGVKVVLRRSSGGDRKPKEECPRVEGRSFTVGRIVGTGTVAI